MHLAAAGTRSGRRGAGATGGPPSAKPARLPRQGAAPPDSGRWRDDPPLAGAACPRPAATTHRRASTIGELARGILGAGVALTAPRTAPREERLAARRGRRVELRCVKRLQRPAGN